MAFTAGSIFGKYDGQLATNSTQSFVNGSNLGNPNVTPALDILQIRAPGNAVLLQLTAGFVVNVNVAAGSFTTTTAIATYQMTIAQYNSLPASPSASQICAAAFPANYNGPQWDLLQVETDITSGAVGQTGAVLGGSAEIGRLTYQGVWTTS